MFVLVADDAVEHLLHRAGEHEAIFSAIPRTWPHIRDGTLYVENEAVLEFRELTSSVDQLLTWGASFTIFAQSYTRPSVSMTGHIICVKVLRTDMTNPPKKWPRMAEYVHCAVRRAVRLPMSVYRYSMYSEAQTTRVPDRRDQIGER